MQNSYHQIIGTFDCLADLRIAYNNLKQKQFNVLEVKAKSENQKYEPLDEKELSINTSYVDDVRKIAIMLIWTVLPSMILGMFALFNYWRPNEISFNLFIVLAFSSIGAAFGFIQGKKHVARRFMKPIKHHSLQKGKILIKTCSDKEMLQVKSVLYQNHVKEIDLA